MTSIKKFFRFGVLVWAAYLPLLYGVATVSSALALGKSCLSPALKDKRHSDFPRGLRWVPWSATSWCMEEPPKKLLGSQKSASASLAGKFGPKPVPEPGTWQISVVRLKRRLPFFLPYLAYTAKNKMHFRIGCRWDDVDHYYVFPSIALKKVR